LQAAFYRGKQQLKQLQAALQEIGYSLSGILMRKTTAETFVSGILSKILNSLPSVPEVVP
jgi:hypothetical protein